MAFIDFDDISKTLAGKGKEAAQKAKDVAEIVQLKAQATSEKNKVKALYSAIGQLYYKNHRDDADGEYQSIVDEITRSLAMVAELQEKVRKLDGSVICPSCGAVIRKGNSFCGKCGAAAPVPAETEEEAEEAAAEAPAEAEATAEADVVASEDAAEAEAAVEAAAEADVPAEADESAVQEDTTGEAGDAGTEIVEDDTVEEAVAEAARIAEEAADEVKSEVYGE